MSTDAQLPDRPRDRVALHGVPGDEAGTIRMHPVVPFVGAPPPSVALLSFSLDGVLVSGRVVVFFYLYTDAEGIPHYRQRCSERSESQARGVLYGD